MEEKQLEHFSHKKHPLILCELRKENDDGSIDQKSAVCYGCQQQILDPAAYCCFRCDFFLHKRCAELPRQIRHPMHSQHDLVLHGKSPYSSRISCVCNACGQRGWEFFTYHCSLCEFDLDVSCAILDQREIKLDCHDHPLIQRKRPATFYCNACGKDVKDSSYLCTVCPFWIHKKCALLSSTVKHKDHNHPLHLAYSLPSENRSFRQGCSVCREKVHPSRWVYYCGPCRYFVHVTCVVISQEDEGQLSEDIEYPISGEQDQNVVKLPSRNAAQELIARFLLKEDEISSGNDSGKSNIPENIFIDSHRKHPLVLSQKVQNLDEIKSTANSDDQAIIAVLARYSSIEDIEYPISGEQDQNVVKLPSRNAAQELIARFLLKEDEISSGNDSGKSNIPENIFIDSHRKHPLVLSQKVQNLDEIKSTANSDDQEEAKALLVCDVCIEPICSSDDLRYYACVECGYFVHLTCSKLPHKLRIPQHPQHPFSLTCKSSAVGLFLCWACRCWTNAAWWTNAACYKCKPHQLSICIKCASASMITSSVKHDGHKKHLLTPFQSSNPFMRCTACDYICGGGFGFACEDCHVYVCYDCALLPPTTTQRWDKHPLLLIYPPYFDHPEVFYCVLCEKEINPNCWMYHCRECDYSLHPFCVPQVNSFRRVKFGRSLNVNNHSHPLTHVPEAKYKSFCGSCSDRRLDWEEAFECESCSFYLCPLCARQRELPVVTSNE
ncbi:unnamed protein product [Coffea canephora]|uniref:Phorbol-ester/DAG-type domain-containing protein n=1 Tax=Coffea canephora TaxID=49390 RepID=A0A068V2R9_COFCA|nr:unnamed protein product [Coffea canephora]